MRDEIHRCLDAGLRRLHVDVFDGVFVDSPTALTFGPSMVEAIRRSCESHASMLIQSNNNLVGTTTQLQQDDDETTNQRVVHLDLHMCVTRPSRYVDTMALAVASSSSSVVEACFIFPWEAVAGEITEAMALARKIVDAGMQCGVSVNPSTDVAFLFPLLETGLVRVVNILGVEPCFGGQAFEGETVLDKIRILSAWKKKHQHRNYKPLEILVDGGINESTAAPIWKAGADVLVAGTFLFKRSSICNDLQRRARLLLAAQSMTRRGSDCDM